MEENNLEIQTQILKHCGVLRGAINKIMDFNRMLWPFAFKCRKSINKRKGIYRNIEFEEIWRDCSKEEIVLHKLFLKGLKAKGLCDENENNLVHLNVFQPMPLVRALLGHGTDDNELRYYIMKNICLRNDLEMSVRTVHEFHVLADAINLLIPGTFGASNIEKYHEKQYFAKWDYYKKFYPYLCRKLLKGNDAKISGKKRQIDAFIECCRAVGHLEVDYKHGFIRTKPSRIDPEFILSNLFGMPTRIPGFDELFGGGGIMLAEGTRTNIPGHQGGRTTLIKGKCGTGKSLLALTLAVEVARKGGIVCYMPMEQSAGECLYALESMGLILEEDPIFIATNIQDTADLLQNQNPVKGGFIILSTVKNDFKSFLAALKYNAGELNGSYPLRLIIADPINSICGVEMEASSEIRFQTYQVISEIKKINTNLIFVAEKDESANGILKFTENIVDTVIELSVAEKYGYSQRYFQITKSRLQRELRGIHPFRIIAGCGFEIYPSSAAISSRIAPRSSKMPHQPISFGLQSLDEILKAGAITSGDIIVLKGPGGSLKTPLGLYFLFERDSSGLDEKKVTKTKSLFISARDKVSKIKSILTQQFVKNHAQNAPKGPADIQICSLPQNFIHPGYIFQRIEKEFLIARLSGKRIDRVMLDNIAYWEMNCPFIGNDKTFGNILLDFLRAKGVTSLIVCGEPQGDSTFSLQHSIIDGADCVINLNRFRFRGMNRIVLSILKSHDMRHRREAFELIFDGNAISVRSYSSLLRFISGQEIKTVKIRLFLHFGSNIQSNYHNSIRNSLLAMLSNDTSIEEVDTIYMNKTMSMVSYSAMDELQVLQVNEAQLQCNRSLLSGNELPLHCFDDSQWDKNEWGSFLPNLKHRVFKKKKFYAVPYLENISFLAYREDILESEDVECWENLEKKCTEWEFENSDKIFFDFPKKFFENYNSLFLEILFSYYKSEETHPKCFVDFLDSSYAVKAAMIYRRLCRRAHFIYIKQTSTSFCEQDKKVEGQFYTQKVDPEAVVWRHWYSTVNQMISEFGSIQKEFIRVIPLPRNVTISDEWFLVIPEYSAAPDVGLEVIKLMTSRDAEFNRMRLGVGLPTRSNFYDSNETESTANAPISPYFSMDLKTIKTLVDNSKRRSNFGCYSKLSRLLAYYLIRIIEIPEISEIEIEKMIKELFAVVKSQMQFIGINKVDCREIFKGADCLRP